ncbi:MAG: DUF3540 domain-containing protein [Sandaracinaceae bacterium]|nr:DUF3540 domain-containing protein [Sandaracinaceae bacterium]
MATEHLIDPSTLDPEALALRGEIYTGRVGALLDGELAVVHEGRSTLARRAASCLLAPAAGDTVLVARTGGRAYVLAVLERESDERAIEVEGDLHLRSRGGAVTIEAEDDPPAPGARRAGDRGPNAHPRGRAGELGRGQRARPLRAPLLESTRMKQVASLSEVVVESVKETLGRAYRSIREGEHVEAGSMTLSVKNLLRSHADTAIVTADKLVKLDGDQIHLG